MSPDYTPAFRFEFFVPKQYNPDARGQRESVPESKFGALHRRLVTAFPGVTMSEARPPVGQGLWRDRLRNVVSDVCYLYDIIVDPDERHRTVFSEMIRELLGPRDQGVGFDQKAVLLVLSRVEVLYAERDDD